MGTDTNFLPRQQLSIFFIVFADIDHRLPMELIDRDAPLVRYLFSHFDQHTRFLISCPRPNINSALSHFKASFLFFHVLERQLGGERQGKDRLTSQNCSSFVAHGSFLFAFVSFLALLALGPALVSEPSLATKPSSDS